MSEVIENYIRKHPGVPEGEAFEGFLRDERIRRWVGDDNGRRERLRREFTKVYASIGTGGAEVQQVPPATGRSGPAGPTPAATAPRTLRVEVHHPSPEGPARQLQLLCTACAKYDVWLQDGVIACRQCGTEYDDMLSLIPVKPVGPFAFVFGEGIAGIATAGALGGGLVLLYILVRYVL